MPARDHDDLTPGPAGEDPPARAGRVAQPAQVVFADPFTEVPGCPAATIGP